MTHTPDNRPHANWCGLVHGDKNCTCRPPERATDNSMPMAPGYTRNDHVLFEERRMLLQRAWGITIVSGADTAHGEESASYYVYITACDGSTVRGSNPAAALSVLERRVLALEIIPDVGLPWEENEIELSVFWPRKGMPGNLPSCRATHVLTGLTYTADNARSEGAARAQAKLGLAVMVMALKTRSKVPVSTMLSESPPAAELSKFFNAPEQILPLSFVAKGKLKPPPGVDDLPTVLYRIRLSFDEAVYHSCAVEGYECDALVTRANAEHIINDLTKRLAEAQDQLTHQGEHLAQLTEAVDHPSPADTAQTISTLEQALQQVRDLESFAGGLERACEGLRAENARLRKALPGYGE